MQRNICVCVCVSSGHNLNTHSLASCCSYGHFVMAPFVHEGVLLWSSGQVVRNLKLKSASLFLLGRHIAMCSVFV